MDFGTWKLDHVKASQTVSMFLHAKLHLPPGQNYIGGQKVVKLLCPLDDANSCSVQAVSMMTEDVLATRPQSDVRDEMLRVLMDMRRKLEAGLQKDQLPLKVMFLKSDGFTPFTYLDTQRTLREVFDLAVEESSSLDPTESESEPEALPAATAKPKAKSKAPIKCKANAVLKKPALRKSGSKVLSKSK